MAWILRNSGDEERYGKVERVASQKNTNVYLEAVEEAENKGRKPKEIRYAQVAGLPKRKHPKRILGYCREWDINPRHNKLKTCTQGILRYIRSVQVYARGMIEPPCTERYARWCERSAAQLMGSLLLDFSLQWGDAEP